MRTQFMKWLISILAVVLVVALIVGILSLREYSQNLKSEYLTAGITRTTIDFVRKHPDQWPANWKDLNSDLDLGGHVHFNFKLTTQEILKDRRVLDRAIEPRARKWSTYPHHEKNLDELFEAIKASQPSRPNSEE